MEDLRKFEEHVEAFLAAHSVTSGNNDRSALEVVLGSLDMMVKDLDNIGLGGNIFIDIGIDNLTGSLALVESFLHDARADGSHLRTVVGIDDRSDDIASESWADLIEKVLVGLAALVVCVRTDLKLGTVGGEAAGQRGRDPWAEVTTDDGRTHQADLGLLLLEQAD